MISYLLIIFICLFVIELLYFKIADKYNIIDKPNQRSSHSEITLRGGGILFYLAGLFYFCLSGFQYPFFVLGLTFVSLVSFYDDIKPLGQLPRLICHFIGLILLFWQWDLFVLFWWWIPVALIFCTGIINVYNFMDGVNGITGGYSLVVLSILLYVNHFQIPFVDENLIWIILLSLLVFNFFNFRKKAKCFAGDVGSVSIAFIILFLLGKLIIQTQNLTWIILLGVYGVDSVLTIIHRLLLHENIGEPHRKHAYQIMANELKMPHIYVSLIYMFLQLIIAVIYLSLPASNWIVLIGCIILLSLLYLFFMKKFFYLHQQ
ncbi:MAG: glycosyltransferase family 4 protein [Tannerellaceae bacterium]|nr:glycosyltransferase family 4 protein [Tannerellaceae bacterium]